MMYVAKSLIFEKVVTSGEVVDIGLRNIALLTRADKRPRFVIYLPTDRSDIWELLWEKGARVRVILVIPEEELKKIGEEESVRKGG